MMEQKGMTFDHNFYVVVGKQCFTWVTNMISLYKLTNVFLSFICLDLGTYVTLVGKGCKTHYWSIIGPKLLVGIFTDQQYCTYNVQYCWCLICTNNIAPSPCKMFAR